ncbi:hypothetical protein AB0D90_25050, partial [Streptomyces althioticus]|uniref:hypothetical protein n=1 Tax=Streptomyces althioticus TaxID=83380 RepID=UPI00340C2FFA
EITPGASYTNGTATIDGDTEDYRFAAVGPLVVWGAVSHALSARGTPQEITRCEAVRQRTAPCQNL